MYRPQSPRTLATTLGLLVSASACTATSSTETQQVAKQGNLCSYDEELLEQSLQDAMEELPSKTASYNFRVETLTPTFVDPEGASTEVQGGSLIEKQCLLFDHGGLTFGLTRCVIEMFDPNTNTPRSYLNVPGVLDLPAVDYAMGNVPGYPNGDTLPVDGLRAQFALPSLARWDASDERWVLATAGETEALYGARVQQGALGFVLTASIDGAPARGQSTSATMRTLLPFVFASVLVDEQTTSSRDEQPFVSAIRAGDYAGALAITSHEVANLVECRLIPHRSSAIDFDVPLAFNTDGEFLGFPVNRAVSSARPLEPGSDRYLSSMAVVR